MPSRWLLLLPWGDTHWVTDGELHHVLATLKGEKDDILFGGGDIVPVDGKDLVSSTNPAILECWAVRELRRQPDNTRVAHCTDTDGASACTVLLRSVSLDCVLC